MQQVEAGYRFGQAVSMQVICLISVVALGDCVRKCSSAVLKKIDVVVRITDFIKENLVG